MRFRRTPRSSDAHLREGLSLLNARLGMSPAAEHNPQDTHPQSTRIQSKRIQSTRIQVHPTESFARNIYYGPDMDGNAEPGEVVWAVMPSDPPSERAMLVIGRTSHDLLGLLIAPHKDEHGGQWLSIGTGDWDNSQASWVRLDKTLIVPESHVRRCGAILPARRFELIANRLRDTYHWN